MDKLETLIACLPNAPYKTLFAVEINALRAEIVTLQSDNTRLTLELDEAGSNCSMYKQQVLNARADNARLRGVMQHSHDYGYVREIQAEALALPSDDSALMERLKEEREKCALEAMHWGNEHMAAKIRSMT